MIKFILVDDNERHSKLVKKVIISYMMKNKLDFTIDIFNDDNKPLRDYIKNRKYDSIYILDIELPSGDGIEVARYIRNVINDWRSPIIFYTSHDNLLYDMYIEKMQILDFISKAVDIEPPNNTLLQRKSTSISLSFSVPGITIKVSFWPGSACILTTV